MSQKTEKMEFLILSEDSGPSWLPVWKAILTKMLFLAEPQLAPRAVAFAPAAKEITGLAAYNGWKSKKRHERNKRVTLARVIAARLKQAGHYVVFHVDGDCRWSESDFGRRSENLQAFQKVLLPLVTDQLQSTRNGDESAMLDGLFVLVPYYSVESWLYQNTTEVVRILQERRQAGKQALNRFEPYRDAPGRIEELLAPKDDKEIRLDLGSRHNQRLAECGFPAKRLYSLRQSFHHAVK